MKQWMQKLIDQFGFEWSEMPEREGEVSSNMDEGLASLIYLIDTYNKHLIEIDSKPVRKVRETLDEFAKELMSSNEKDISRVLFRFRQFFSSYRISEYTYIQKTFDDFRGIIWDFIDQLSEDLSSEELEDQKIEKSFENLKEAVEANSIDTLKSQSREFVDNYIEYKSNREKRRNQKLRVVNKNLDFMKKKLVEANQNMRLDHLTKAYNRKSFDEQMKQHKKLSDLSGKSVSLVMLDIDHFKKVNDTYGHQVGDFVLVELVKLLHKIFDKDSDFVARIGGEEFAVILPENSLSQGKNRADDALRKIREEVFILEDGSKLQFTVSMGIAELDMEESVDAWMKRADAALYESKNKGRNKLTIAPQTDTSERVA